MENQQQNQQGTSNEAEAEMPFLVLLFILEIHLLRLQERLEQLENQRRQMFQSMLQRAQQIDPDLLWIRQASNETDFDYSSEEMDVSDDSN